jgi:hypothetical protein
MRIAKKLALALALVTGPALAQVVVGGGAGIVYGPYPYGAFAPYGIGGAGVSYGPYPYGVYAPYGAVEPWAGVGPRYPDATPSCYRYGRCTPAEVAAYRYRVERLDRLAPAAPPEAALPEPLRPPPPPTAVEDIRPEYRGASVVKEEYRDSGRPVDGRQ